MAYDEVLAGRIRELLDGEPGVTSRKMFGGLGFMVDGHMAVAAGSSGALMVRADPADCATWTDGLAVNPMEMRGRAMAGWLLVDSAAVVGDDQLGQWVDRGVRFVRTLPPKQSSP
jgi:TfoX/Sxy family transcriptional regulator of competence genes